MRLNAHYARRLSLYRLLPRIMRLIGCRTCPPMSPAFVAALIRWQRAHGLPPTGVLSPEVLRLLLARLQAERTAAPFGGSGPVAPMPLPGDDAHAATDGAGVEPPAEEPPEDGGSGLGEPLSPGQADDGPPADDTVPEGGDSELGVGFRRRRSMWDAQQRQRPAYGPIPSTYAGQPRLGVPAPRHVTRLTPWRIGFRP